MSESEQTEKFEAMLEQLEYLAKCLEDDQLPLDESLKKYEQGLELISKCQMQLKLTKEKIDALHDKYLNETEN